MKQKRHNEPYEQEARVDCGCGFSHQALTTSRFQQEGTTECDCGAELKVRFRRVKEIKNPKRVDISLRCPSCKDVVPVPAIGIDENNRATLAGVCTRCDQQVHSTVSLSACVAEAEYSGIAAYVRDNSPELTPEQRIHLAEEPLALM